MNASTEELRHWVPVRWRKRAETGRPHGGPYLALFWLDDRETKQQTKRRT